MKTTIAALLLFFTEATLAQHVLIRGGLDCGLWLEARNTDSSSHFELYLQGFVNGLAIGREIDIWQGGGRTVSVEQLYFWMDNYCRQNPLSDTLTGVLSFSDERTGGAFSEKSRYR